MYTTLNDANRYSRQQTIKGDDKSPIMAAPRRVRYNNNTYRIKIDTKLIDTLNRCGYHIPSKPYAQLLVSTNANTPYERLEVSTAISRWVYIVLALNPSPTYFVGGKSALFTGIWKLGPLYLAKIPPITAFNCPLDALQKPVIGGILARKGPREPVSCTIVTFS